MAIKNNNETAVATALKRILLEDTPGVLSEPEALAFVALESQIPDAVMTQCLEALDAKFRRQLVKILSPVRQMWWLENSKDKQDVGFLFAALPPQEQERLLSLWFVSNRDRYLWIKESASQRTITIGDLWVRTDTALPELIPAEVETVLDAIQKGAEGPAAFAEFLAPRVGRYAPDVLETIGKLVIETFLNLKIPISTPSSFLMHLKCHMYHDYLVSAIPGIAIAAYSQLLQQFVMALGQMPDGEWVMKVLVQMPAGALRQLFGVMRDAGKSGGEPQRTTCLRLIREIGERVDRPEFDHVRLAYAA
jgi:hypothetical protein